MIGAETTIIDNFDAVESEILEQSQAGLRSMAKAVMATAVDSMVFGGNVYGSPGYKSAAEGEPPRKHTGEFAESIEMAAKGDRMIVGSSYLDVELLGTWFEYGGRPLKPGEKMHPRQKRWKHHPWIRPALRKEIDTFAPRVAGSFV